MKGRDGFLPGYNAQAAVDAKAQVIVAHGLTDCAVDCGQLVGIPCEFELPGEIAIIRKEGDELII